MRPTLSALVAGSPDPWLPVVQGHGCAGRRESSPAINCRCRGRAARRRYVKRWRLLVGDNGHDGSIRRIAADLSDVTGREWHCGEDRNMRAALRIAHVGSVATRVPPPFISSSAQLMASLLTEGVVARGQNVTLFATDASTTMANVHALFPRDAGAMARCGHRRPYEIMNVAAAVERAREFDILHVQAPTIPIPMAMAVSRLSPTPIVQTLHYLPAMDEVTPWLRYPEASFAAVSKEQPRCLRSKCG